MGTGRTSFGTFLFRHSFSWGGKLISITFGDLNAFPPTPDPELTRLPPGEGPAGAELEAIHQDFLHERDTIPDKGELVSDEEEDT
nr:TBC1 domain family member 2B-like [Aotus nancymaae]